MNKKILSNIALFLTALIWGYHLSLKKPAWIMSVHSALTLQEVFWAV